MTTSKILSLSALLLAGILLMFMVPMTALAADDLGANTGGDDLGANTTPTPSDGTLVNPLKVEKLEDLLGLILDAVIELGTIVLILALIWVGFLFVKAQGKPEEITKAKQAFIWTIIGGLILLGARGLMEVIKSTVNTL